MNKKFIEVVDKATPNILIGLLGTTLATVVVGIVLGVVVVL